MGRGEHIRAKKPINVHAQLTPRFLNIGETKRGKLRVSMKYANVSMQTDPTPKSDRSTEFAASTEAA